MSGKYNHKKLEEKWSKRWIDEGTNRPKSMREAKNKFYNLWMFPYPSAEGLHAGHAFSSTGSDVYGRYMRMNGACVFQPMGFDSFGIHSENYAIKAGQAPQDLIDKTTSNYENQLKSLGHGYDWTRTLTTSHPDYYKWTQWLFVELFKAGLAYRAEAEVNWCPSCRTVLADEQVMSPKAAGKLPPEFSSYEDVPEDLMVCERCGHIVERKKLAQWFFRITEYADRLLENLPKIDWPEKIKLAQTNWIGRKAGLNITYAIEGMAESVTCWTSRPETNFGASFIVLAPEASLVLKITTKDQKEAVLDYIQQYQKKSKKSKKVQTKEKTGVFTGSYAVSPLTGSKLPIWVSDFVLSEFGTGAVVGVPAHDRRDFEFAEKFKLPVVPVVSHPEAVKHITKPDNVWEGEGVMINSAFLNGMHTSEAKSKIIDHLVSSGSAEPSTHYHLRDWLISRQRYWGPPIPMIYCERCAKAGRSYFTENTTGGDLLCDKHSQWESAGWYPESDLPVELPKIDDYLPKGSGRGPLADHPEFYEVACPVCSATAKRETDVSDTFLDSSWYFLRYPSVGLESASKIPFDKDITKDWLPVDLYFGGAEHAVLHLMYARFVNMVLYDRKMLTFEEPFPRFYAHGLMIKDGAKMSKSRGNVVNPDEYIEKYGADTMRLYLMFMGPMDGYPDFRDSGIEGMRRFTERVWDIFVNFEAIEMSKEDESKLSIKLHQTIKKVSEDMQKFRYNTAIASIMELVNSMREVALPSGAGESKVWTEAKEALVKMMAPFAPFMAEEIWSVILKKDFSVHTSAWPHFDPKLASQLSRTIAVQVNGKVRGTLILAAEHAGEKAMVEKEAKELPNVSKHLQGKSVKTIFVPGKIINFVISRT